MAYREKRADNFVRSFFYLTVKMKDDRIYLARKEKVE